MHGALTQFPHTRKKVHTRKNVYSRFVLLSADDFGVKGEGYGGVVGGRGQTASGATISFPQSPSGGFDIGTPLPSLDHPLYPAPVCVFVCVCYACI